MKAKVITFLMLMILSGYVHAYSKIFDQSPNIKIVASDVEFPLCFEKIDFQNSPAYYLDSSQETAIRNVILDFYKECIQYDSLKMEHFNPQDVYMHTIRLYDDPITVFVVLLNHIPRNAVVSKVLFYDNQSLSFIPQTFYFDISGLYNNNQGFLEPRWLKNYFSVASPEIELSDYDNDGANDFIFKTLLHLGEGLGDVNMIETNILRISNNKIDTLLRDRAYLNNKCFDISNGYPDYVYSNTIITKTQQGNHLMKVSINDSLYIRYYGRNEINKIIDTVYCDPSKNVRLPILEWETDEFIGLTLGCGTYCWTNILVPVQTNDPVMHFTISAIDFENMNILEINDNFKITNLRTKKEITVPIAGIECIKGFTLFFIDSVELKDDTISYTIRCENETVIQKTIKFSLQDVIM